MNTEVKTVEYRGYEIEIHVDECMGNPRREYDGFLGTFITWHRNYESPDPNPFNSPQDFRDHAEYEEYPVVIPVYMYEHGNIAFRAGDSNPFRSPWDSGQVGYIYVDQETFDEFTGIGRTEFEEILHKEVENFSYWASGQVYGFYIPELEDSCWGFIGPWDRNGGALSEAKSIIDHVIKRKAKEHTETLAQWENFVERSQMKV